MDICRIAELRNEGFSCQVSTEWISKIRLCRERSQSGRRSGETGGNCRGTLAKGVRHVRRRLHYVNYAPLNNTIDEIARPALSTSISDAFVIFATTYLAHYSLCHKDMAKGEVD
jgi:hypothetical protein